MAEDVRRITDLKSCVGKVVVATCEDHADSFGFRFEDGTYLYGKAEEDSCSDGPGISFRYATPDDDESFALGLITEEEYRERRAKAKVQQEAWDRASYERLKAKFEGAASPAAMEG